MIARRRQERPEKPEHREEPTRPWVAHSAPEQPARDEFRPTSHERMTILVDSLCSRWPRARRELVAAAHHQHVWRHLLAVPGQVWADLAEAKAQGRKMPGRLRRQLQGILAPLAGQWTRRW